MTFVPNSANNSSLSYPGNYGGGGSRQTRKVRGLYHIGSKTFKELIGSRSKVYHETAYKTKGGLTKKDLLKNKHGRIVSRKKHFKAKRDKILQKNGYYTRKGVFGYFKK